MKTIKQIFRKFINKFFSTQNSKIPTEGFPKYILGRNVEFSDSEIDDYSYISPNSKIHSATIGKFCSIGPHVIVGYGEHPISFLSTSPLFYYGTQKFDIKIALKDYFNHHEKVIIKNDVWIGANVYVKNGITIGNGAVIAAGATIIKDVPDYAIMGGVPAKIIKYRFDNETIEMLLKLKWWDWEISKIEKYHDLFVREDFKNILDKLESEIQ